MHFSVVNVFITLPWHFYIERVENNDIQSFQKDYVATRADLLINAGKELSADIQSMNDIQRKYFIRMGEENIIRSMVGWASFGPFLTYNWIHVLLKHFISYCIFRKITFFQFLGAFHKNIIVPILNVSSDLMLLSFVMFINLEIILIKSASCSLHCLRFICYFLHGLLIVLVTGFRI